MKSFYKIACNWKLLLEFLLSFKNLKNLFLRKLFLLLDIKFKLNSKAFEKFHFENLFVFIESSKLKIFISFII